MLLFRSEEHIERWRKPRGIARGATLTVVQQWDLARAWYSNRMERDWRRRTPVEAETIFAGIGLTGAFWKLR
jgi:Alkylmercury lyase